MRNLIRQKIIDSEAALVPAFTRRDVYVPSVKGKAVAIVGMRRTGKSTLLWQIAADHIGRGLSRDGLLYFNFEDERLTELKASDLHIVLDEYYSLHPEWRGARRAVLMFDEIQVVPGWEKFTRRLLDTENIDLYVTGSSAKLLSREVATSMRGRALEALVHPFSFREFLRHLGLEPVKGGLDFPKQVRSELQNRLYAYLKLGGFPETLGTSPRDHANLLKGYVDTALLRDVVERYAVSQPVALRRLVRHLLANPAGTFSISKFHHDMRSQGMAIAKDTLHTFLNYLEDSFLVRTVSVSSASERRRMVNPRRAYPIDPGLIPLFDRTGRENLGHALETIVMLELERRGAEIAYVKNPDGSEVDFLARYPAGGETLVQVCATVEDRNARDRELKALFSARHDFPHGSLHLITLDPEAPPDLPHDIAWHWAAEWLLAE